MMTTATKARETIATKVGQRRSPFVDLIEVPPFWIVRNDLVAGDGRLLVSWFDSPSYLGALSTRDSRGVFSTGSPD